MSQKKVPYWEQDQDTRLFLLALMKVVYRDRPPGALEEMTFEEFFAVMVALWDRGEVVVVSDPDFQTFRFDRPADSNEVAW